MRLFRRRLDNIFLRVYLGVFAALISILLLGTLLVTLANQVRLEAHQENLLSGLFASLTQEQFNTPQSRDHWLQQLRQETGLDLQLVRENTLELSGLQKKRLNERRLLLQEQQNGDLRVYYPTRNQGWLLTTDFQQLTEQQLRATARLWYHRLKEDSDFQLLQDYQSLYAYPLQPIDTPFIEAPDLQQQTSAPGQLVTWYQENPASLVGYIQLNENHWLKLGPVEFFNPYPFPLLGGIFLASFAILAMSIWWFLHGLGERLRSLERASSQLAAGNLKARVAEQEKDFIGKLAAAFNHMAEQIQRLLRTQQEMIHAVSHELRTPVARIRFGLQMIEDLSEEERPHQELVRQVQGIDKDIDELDTLIDEILTYARLGQEKLQLQFVNQDVEGLLEDVISGFQRVNPDMELQLLIENPGHFTTEADLEGRYFQRAIQNLVGNAVRYAQARIHITCHLEADNLRVDVEDDGAGIPEEDWQRVFMPFSRLDDSRTRSSGGYGLGLSIVQRIIYWHRGSALVDRSPHLGGARFSLIFPKSQAENLPPLDIPPQ
ncbi:ATP-binding protein [Marinospirillum perlucidum]|uniref:ATP-binding protein n=1 Tax=Marinospirillum perlucidum TaxID=1982602 RepID=UPI000DF2EB71|nr:ATP-binding protein [Marinospirillum perlucidum]